MSKFKVGDWWDIQDASYEMIADLVDELEQDGWYVEGYIQMNGLQECVRWPRIGLRPECGTITLFTSNNYDFEESRKLPLSVIGQTECPYTLIDELEAQVENLEELVSDQAHQINQLTEALDNFTRLTHYFSTEGASKLPNAKLGDSVVDAILNYFKGDFEKQFKPVREYTLEDWEQAIANDWVFETRCGEKVTIDLINGEECNRPILCSAGWYHHINGMWNDITGEDADDDIIRRVS